MTAPVETEVIEAVAKRLAARSWAGMKLKPGVDAWQGALSEATRQEYREEAEVAIETSDKARGIQVERMPESGDLRDSIAGQPVLCRYISPWFPLPVEQEET